MEEQITYRGRAISSEDILFIRHLIARHPEASRWRLSKQLCEAWDWRQSNGTLRDVLCRGLMLWLHRNGHIQLPARKKAPRKHPGRRRKPTTDILLDQSPIHGPLQALRPLEIRQVRRTGMESVFNSLIERDHYLGYTQSVGEHIKYMVFSHDRPVACLVWSSSPWHIGSRDRFIGWTPTMRKRNLRLITCNTRFLILPWVRVPHLASHILGRMARQLSNDWQDIYGHPIYYLETFVDQERFAGTCYKAANWINLGQTTGRWRKDKKGEKERHIKDILGYALSKNFRELLREDLP